ncbi:MAG: type II secretion system protein [bacterium]|nr:type II secretion system protein [bacterium]
MKKRKGFTLVEIMVVVMIIGILLAIMIPRVNMVMDRGREKATHKNLQAIQAAVNAYCVRDTEDVYPTSDANFKAILSEYFEEVPYALLKRNAVNPNENKVVVAASTANIDNSGGWVLVIGTTSDQCGRVFINSQEKDTFHIYYSTYSPW